MNNFTFRLDRYRYERGMSQRKLAKAIGVEPSYVSLLKDGKRLPSFEVLLKIADVLSVSLDALCGRGRHGGSVEERLSHIEDSLKKIERKVGISKSRKGERP